MKGREIIAAIMDKTGTTNADLAHKLQTSLATMWDRVNGQKTRDIPLSTMNEMVRAMGYKVIVVPSNRKMKEDEYEVTGVYVKPAPKRTKRTKAEETGGDSE